jgi:penicillin-binding protein 2
MTGMTAEKNRATQENYMPGSIFKLVVGMAALEAGWDPNKIVKVPENPRERGKGYIRIGNHDIRDTAAPGDYDFKLALKRSSNTYFVTCGTNIGPERILRLGHLLHLGERTGFAKTAQEVSGSFPGLQRLDSHWTVGNTANISIGQDPVWVTPLQVAVLTAAIANGGKVLKPRLVDRVESADPFASTPPEVKPSGVVRENLGISERTLSILHEAMLGDTEDADGTGKHVRDHTPLTGLRICAKTGTAQVQNERNVTISHDVWFASFAPYCPPGSNEKPRYAVVVMVENGDSGGKTCAPVAGLIYQALMDREKVNHGNVGPLARGN